MMRNSMWEQYKRIETSFFMYLQEKWRFEASERADEEIGEKLQRKSAFSRPLAPTRRTSSVPWGILFFPFFLSDLGIERGRGGEENRARIQLLLFSEVNTRIPPGKDVERWYRRFLCSYIYSSNKRQVTIRYAIIRLFPIFMRNVLTIKYDGCILWKIKEWDRGSFAAMLVCVYLNSLLNKLSWPLN